MCSARLCIVNPRANRHVRQANSRPFLHLRCSPPSSFIDFERPLLAASSPLQTNIPTSSESGRPPPLTPCVAQHATRERTTQSLRSSDIGPETPNRRPSRSTTTRVQSRYCKPMPRRFRSLTSHTRPEARLRLHATWSSRVLARHVSVAVLWRRSWQLPEKNVRISALGPKLQHEFCALWNEVFHLAIR